MSSVLIYSSGGNGAKYQFLILHRQRKKKRITPSGNAFYLMLLE